MGTNPVTPILLRRGHLDPDTQTPREEDHLSTGERQQWGSCPENQGLTAAAGSWRRQGRVLPESRQGNKDTQENYRAQGPTVSGGHSQDLNPGRLAPNTFTSMTGISTLWPPGHMGTQPIFLNFYWKVVSLTGLLSRVAASAKMREE